MDISNATATTQRVIFRQHHILQNLKVKVQISISTQRQRPPLPAPHPEVLSSASDDVTVQLSEEDKAVTVPGSRPPGPVVPTLSLLTQA